ncbi:hypothetical protein N0V94_003070 [Neodidymelliopsis sp. IMI 364377]|nr:hypothetical protein N0V94_003070 [Neodidymelliopsis sp. IMI 364377]
MKPKIKIGEAPKHQSRNSIEDIWGPRTPYKHEWPTRVDEAKDEEPDKMEKWWEYEDERPIALIMEDLGQKVFTA